MQFIDRLNTPGEHLLTLQGAVGALEATLTVPPTCNTKIVAILGHPHSLQGGTMNNKVVTTMARAFKDLGIPSLRFNFRGVGLSDGVYDAGIGESEDMIALVEQWQKEQANVSFIFAGFSFGSFVAYRAASHFPGSMLITIAPSVHNYDYKAFEPRPKSWLIIQGEEDEVVSADLVYEFAQEFEPPLPVIRFANTGHFFHGKLLDLKAQLTDYVRTEASVL